MSDKIEAIRKAAKGLEDALNLYGGNAEVWAQKMEVTHIESTGREFRYSVQITEEKQLPP